MEKMPFGEAIDPDFHGHVKAAVLQEVERFQAGDPPVEGSLLTQLGRRFAEWQSAFVRGQSIKNAARTLNGDYWELSLKVPTGAIPVELGIGRNMDVPEVRLIEELMWARIDLDALPRRSAPYPWLELPDVDSTIIQKAYGAVRSEILWDTNVPEGRGAMAHVTMDYLIDGMITGQIGVGFRHEAV